MSLYEEGYYNVKPVNYDLCDLELPSKCLECAPTASATNVDPFVCSQDVFHLLDPLNIAAWSELPASCHWLPELHSSGNLNADLAQLFSPVSLSPASQGTTASAASLDSLSSLNQVFSQCFMTAHPTHHVNVNNAFCLENTTPTTDLSFVRFKCNADHWPVGASESCPASPSQFTATCYPSPPMQYQPLTPTLPCHDQNSIPCYPLSPALSTDTPPFLVYSSPETQMSPHTLSRKKAATEFPCEICGKRFTRPYNRKSHMRTHQNDKPFPCDHPRCGKNFARLHDLKRHQRIHTGVKPHKCNFCARSFARRDALNRHWKVDPKCKVLANRNPAVLIPLRNRR